MKVAGRWRRAIEIDERGDVRVLDQVRLPNTIEWLALRDLDDSARAIRDMHVRGAPLIGAVAAAGVALALREGVALDLACEVLAATRPTAVNLAWALAAMKATLAERAGTGGSAMRAVDADLAMQIAREVCEADVARNDAIGTHGLALLETRVTPQRQLNVLTHCNAGWLATVDWGTALAPIYKAHDAGLAIHVWVEETRPRNQGLLTAWELAQHGVPHTVIVDNAGGHFMQRGDVDVCIVGTDRTTANGDVCNKIGTYQKALAAHDCDVPFYVAAPSPSIDWTIADGAAIPIEERSGDEVRLIGAARILSDDTNVANPAFDVTPHRLVTKIITERGTCDATKAGLAALFPDLVVRG
ncbi:MAG: S-methyl-5-thioribose-1-phosphate isomerase [Kofleriaceae bacterium]